MAEILNLQNGNMKVTLTRNELVLLRESEFATNELIAGYLAVFAKNGREERIGYDLTEFQYAAVRNILALAGIRGPWYDA
jgi:hypothetical protein